MTASLRKQSGYWTGRWTHGKESMRLSISHGKIYGRGRDGHGLCLYVGLYGEDGSVYVEKKYHVQVIEGPAHVIYEGKWEGDFVAGTWRLPDEAEPCGEFEWWPQGAGVPLVGF